MLRVTLLRSIGMATTRTCRLITTLCGLSTIVVTALCLLLTTLGVALWHIATILTTHVGDSREVHFGFTTRHDTYIAHDRFVVGVLVVKLVALRTHVTREIYHLCRATLLLSYPINELV